MQDLDRQEAWEETLDGICSLSAQTILSGATFETFRTRLAMMASLLFADLGVPLEAQSEALRQAMATGLAYEIWNATPIPDNHFRPRRIPKPERNAPCPCGSGHKYKQCCGVAQVPSLGINETIMLAHVLGNWPKKRLKELPVRELVPDALAVVAARWLNDGREKDAIALLESLFAHLPELDGRSEAAADMLLSCYLEIGAPRKKQRFIDALRGAPDKVLRSVGWQRQATVECDRGAYPAAWAAFQEAQRLTPNNPALAHLEILLLGVEGRREEARRRADFWVARLARDPHRDHSDMIAVLQDLAAATPESLLRTEARLRGPLSGLAAAIESWPAPACHYSLQRSGALKAKAGLGRVEEMWQTVSPLDGASDIESCQEFLAENPLAGHSFTILRELVGIVECMPESAPGVADALVGRLLERAENLRRTVLGALKAEKKEFSWACLENRPMLNLAASYADFHATDAPEKALEIMRWSVLTANPNDNTGLRENLIHTLVAQGQAVEAADIAAHYSNDFAFTEYGRVLALHGAGRQEEAAQALAKAVAKSPKVWKMLAAASPRQPKMNFAGYTVGGDDEAWVYRESHLALWQSSGALAWAKALPPERLALKAPSRAPRRPKASPPSGK